MRRVHKKEIFDITDVMQILTNEDFKCVGRQLFAMDIYEFSSDSINTSDEILFYQVLN